MPKQFRMLVVDDEIDFLGIIAQDLEEMGVVVYTASNGIDAENFILNHGNIDVVLCDVRMPGKSGIDVLRTVRENDKTKDLRFILMSGYPNSFEKLDPNLRANATIQKPIDMSTFNSLIGL